MCAKRKESLHRVVRQRPVQPVSPAPTHPPPEPDPLRGSHRPNNIYEKSARVCIVDHLSAEFITELICLLFICLLNFSWKVKSKVFVVM